MPDPLTFATEAERLKAREQFVAVSAALYLEPAESDGTKRAWGDAFDRAFPPIAPPKMVPEEWWVLVNLLTRNRVGPLYLKTPIAMAGFRAARVRVEEVDDE